jgi:outer membrane protein assembly factor BamE (lipoprotein component of BamABCDE complex)
VDDNEGRSNVTYRRFRSFSSHARAFAGAAALALVLSGCNSIAETRTHGFILPASALEQIPAGSSQEQVLVVLGTPSTVSTIGGEVYYYIQTTRRRPVAFMNARTVDQRVIAVYFTKNKTVERVADYGIQDGAVFDFIGRTTPTTGEELTFLNQILKAATGTPQLFN